MHIKIDQLCLLDTFFCNQLLCTQYPLRSLCIIFRGERNVYKLVGTSKGSTAAGRFIWANPLQPLEITSRWVSLRSCRPVGWSEAARAFFQRDTELWASRGFWTKKNFLYFYFFLSWRACFCCFVKNLDYLLLLVCALEYKKGAEKFSLVALCLWCSSWLCPSWWLCPLLFSLSSKWHSLDFWTPLTSLQPSQPAQVSPTQLNCWRTLSFCLCVVGALQDMKSEVKCINHHNKWRKKLVRPVYLTYMCVRKSPP